MSHAGGLPGVTDDVGERIVLHVDNDCFYAACERLREPPLDDEPVIIGMGFEPGETVGAVATASYEAREHGVESAQPISEAMERLPPREHVADDFAGPTAIYRPVDIEYYSSCATRVTTVLEEYAGSLRKVSIDEAYLDCTEQTSWGEARSFAAEIKARIADEIGLPVSIGVAPNMAVAKVASDHDKPEGLVVVSPSSVSDFLAPLPVRDLHGIGPKTAATLHDSGIETIGDLANADRGRVSTEFGERGREMIRRARGIDRRPVEQRGDPKSLSRESSFDGAVEDLDRIEARLVNLATAVAERARKQGATYRTIGIKVIEPPYSVNTREQSLPGPVDDPQVVEAVARELFAEFADRPVRKVGVRVSNLSFAAGEQADLGDWEGAKPDNAGRSVTQTTRRRGQLSLEAFEDADVVSRGDR